MSKQLVFGVDTLESITTEQQASKNPNPCIAVYGRGPEGKKCGTCAHLFCMRYSKNYFKCNLRKFTHGAATDHRLKWDACGQYEEGAPEKYIAPK